MVGVKTTMHIKELPGKKVACAIVVDGHPQYNSMTLTSEDVENPVDSPFFGGKAKVKYTRTAKGYTSIVTTENMGVWEYDEEYCEQGIKIVSYSNHVEFHLPIEWFYLCIGRQKGRKMHE